MRIVERCAAEERLLDAELEQVLGRDPVLRQRTSRRSSMLVAAVVLLGVAVAIASATLDWRRAESSPTGEPDSVQDPVEVPLPPAVRAKVGQLDDVPEDVQNLVCTLASPSDIARLRRFSSLRRVAIHALSLRALGANVNLKLGRHREWAKPDSDVLAALATLPDLEHLHLPLSMVLRPEHFAPLTTAAKFHTLVLAGEPAYPTDELVSSLAALPHLRRLELQVVPLDAPAMGRLARLGLRQLDLHHCPGLDAAAFAALGRLDTLRSMNLVGLGGPVIQAGPVENLRAPTVADFEALRKLENLRSLTLRGCTLSDDILAALSPRLSKLELYAVSGIGTGGIAHLRALGQLRELAFRAARDGGPFRSPPDSGRDLADALAGVIPALRLTSLTYLGPMPTRLAEAIASQPDLARLELWVQDHPDLSAFASARALRSVRWINTSLTADDLRPLQACKRLQSLQFLTPVDLDRDELAELFPRVEVSFESDGR